MANGHWSSVLKYKPECILSRITCAHMLLHRHTHLYYRDYQNACMDTAYFCSFPCTEKRLVWSIFEYASSVWHSAANTPTDKVEAVQKRAARLVRGLKQTDYTTSVTKFLNSLSWEKLMRRQTQRKKTEYLLPHARWGWGHHRQLHANSHKGNQKAPTTSMTLQHLRSFFVETAREWSRLPTSSPTLVCPS